MNLLEAVNQLPLAWSIPWRQHLAAMSWLEMAFWLGMASLTLALLLLAGTRWGQVRPVSKCVVLSVLAHILFLCYAYGTSLSFKGALTGDPLVRVKYITAGEPGFEDDELPANNHSLHEIADEQAFSPDAPHDSPAPPANDPEPTVSAPEFAANESSSAPQSVPRLLDEPTVAVDDPANEEPAAMSTASETMPTETEREPAESSAEEAADMPSDVAVAGESMPDPAQPSLDSGTPLTDDPPSERQAEREQSSHQQELATAKQAPVVRPADQQPLPDEYRLRTLPDRLSVARSFGATEESEVAVASALVWLAAQQQRDGRWDASEYGAGRETRTLGHDRRGAGADADTGITGLALLAFLGAGHTHLEGNYRETVLHGLEFLTRSQLADGSLTGDAKDFERMYCHGIALIALGEAYAMTGDSRFLPSLKRGIQFTLVAQDRTSGGWRYRPGDRGDMSQCGWQVMALRSARLGGLAFPDSTETLASKFIDSVMQGPSQGLAAYRPGERASRTMTAEAMACRLLLDMRTRQASVDEACAYLLQELPGTAEPNLYYWYYATWFLFQNQGPAWETWNEALQRNLLGRQYQDGLRAGSWDTTDVWGGYGGRIYTTSMAALCLEVYYRYLPLYDPANATRQAGANRDSDGFRR